MIGLMLRGVAKQRVSKHEAAPILRDARTQACALLRMRAE